MNHALIFTVHDVIPHRPMGAHRIASYLREYEWDVEVADFATYWSLDQLKEFAKSRVTSDTKFFGFSCWFGRWSEHISEFCDWAKDTWPSIKLIYGSMTYPTFDCKSVDYFVVGYGEKALLDLIKSFDSGGPIAFDPKWFGEKKVIIANDTYPAFPMPSLIVKYELRDYIESWEWLTTELSRGCKFNCKFCNFPILGVKEDHSRTSDDFDYQMRDAYDKFGVANYYVADETVNQDKAMMERFASVVDNFDFDLRMHGFIRADLLVNNEDTWDPIIRLGLHGHHYGVETFNKKAGTVIGKGMDPAKLQEGLLKVKKYFSDRVLYRGQISMIAGLPHETRESWEAGVQWLHTNWKGENMNFNVLEIPLDPKGSKLSFFSENYAKLGYRAAKEDIELDLTNYKSNRFSKSLLDWENDHWTMQEAHLTSQENQKRTRDDQTLGVWHWGPFGLRANGDLATIASYAKNETDSPNGEVQEFLARYINNKLNWKKQ